ncbi:hypothetical protein AT728_22020 [Streptomyces silvensis]|uniref:Uncharacterized protein n=1 Tax=Streptomyces silvensis TaxID=1765722 RepID=A0A0W7X8J1_9ACTN|nr:hypothetical protein AT728_22020 [Streptomyces silvensis]
MNADDEQLLRGRVYGRDHDAPNSGPLPHQTYAALVVGPLDGLLLDITGWRPEEMDDGVALMTELGRWPGGRALYDPLPGDPRPGEPPGSGVPLPLLRGTPSCPPAFSLGLFPFESSRRRSEPRGEWCRARYPGRCQSHQNDQRLLSIKEAA